MGLTLTLGCWVPQPADLPPDFAVFGLLILEEIERPSDENVSFMLRLLK